MDRLSFLKAATALGLSPLLISQIENDEKVETVVVNNPKTKGLIIDFDSIKNIGIRKGGASMSAKDVLQLYNETGVLLYRRTDRMGPNYQPVTVFEK